MSSNRGKAKKPESPAAGSPRVEDLSEDQLDKQIEEKVREEIKSKEKPSKHKVNETEEEEAEEDDEEEAEAEDVKDSKKKKGGRKGKVPQADPSFFDFDSLEKLKVMSKRRTSLEDDGKRD